MILTSPSDAMIAGEQDKDARIAELETALENILSGAACLPGYSIADAVEEARAVILGRM